MRGWLGSRAAALGPVRALLGWSAAWHALIAPIVRRDSELRDQVGPGPPLLCCNPAGHRLVRCAHRYCQPLRHRAPPSVRRLLRGRACDLPGLPPASQRDEASWRERRRGSSRGAPGGGQAEAERFVVRPFLLGAQDAPLPPPTPAFAPTPAAQPPQPLPPPPPPPQHRSAPLAAAAAAAAVAAAEAQPRSGGGADGSGRPAASAEAPPRGATAPAQPTRQRSIFAPPQCAPALAAVEARAGRRAGRTWSRFRERLHRHRPAAGQVDTSLCTGGARLPAVASTQVGPREGCLSPAPASRACLLACCRCQPADWRLARDGLEPRLLERPLAPYPAAVDNGAARVEPGAGRAAAPPPGLRLPLKSGGTDGLGSEDGAAAGAAPCGSCDRRFWSCPGSAGFKARRPRAGRACPAACSPRAEAEQRLWTESDVSVRASRDVGRPAERRSLSWQEGSLGRAACDPVAPPSRGGKLRRCLAAGT
jgi:hypothetical protein